jgi:hypothetical protein
VEKILTKKMGFGAGMIVLYICDGKYSFNKAQALAFLAANEG